MRRRWWVLAITGITTMGATWLATMDEIPVFTATANLINEDAAPVVGLEGLFEAAPPSTRNDLEAIQSHTVLRPAATTVAFGLQLLDRPWDRTALLVDPTVSPDAEDGVYVLSVQGDQLVLAAEDGGDIGRFAPGARIQGPGFAFGPTDPSLLETPVSIGVVGGLEAVSRLRDEIVVDEGTGSRSLSVSFTDPDPQYAALVVNAITDAYVEHSASMLKSALRQRRDAIADQLVVLNDSLREAQQRAMDYQSTVQLMDPTVEANALMRNALQTEADLQAQQFRIRVLSTIVSTLEGGDVSIETVYRMLASGGALIPNASVLESELRRLDAERRELTVNPFGLTDDNPEVVIIDEQIRSAIREIVQVARSGLEVERRREADMAERLRSVQGELGGLPTRTTEYERLQRRVTAITGMSDRLLREFFAAQIEEGAQAGAVRVLDRAAAPLEPDPSSRLIMLALALLGGLTVGALGAVTLDNMDPILRRPADIERVTGQPVLGSIPRMSARARDPRSIRIAREAFRGLRTNIRFALMDQPRLLAVSSAAPAEGKSTVAANLALSMAEQGGRTLLIDADLRRPQGHRILGVEPDPGVSEVLMGLANLRDAIFQSPAHPGLFVLPGGSPTASPAELVGGEGFLALVRALETEFDTIIVDTTPMLAVTDASLVGTIADGTLLVVRANRTDRHELARALGQLRRVGARVAGVVLNDLPVTSVPYSAYYDAYVDVKDPDTGPRPVLNSA